MLFGEQRSHGHLYKVQTCPFRNTSFELNMYHAVPLIYTLDGAVASS